MHTACFYRMARLQPSRTGQLRIDERPPLLDLSSSSEPRLSKSKEELCSASESDSGQHYFYFALAVPSYFSALAIFASRRPSIQFCDSSFDLSTTAFEAHWTIPGSIAGQFDDMAVMEDKANSKVYATGSDDGRVESEAPDTIIPLTDIDKSDMYRLGRKQTLNVSLVFGLQIAVI